MPRNKINNDREEEEAIVIALLEFYLQLSSHYPRMNKKSMWEV